METIDYPTRKDLVSALVDFRKRGVHAEVVHNGRTLAFPNGVDATAEDEEEALQQEKEEPADGIEKTSVEGDTLLGVTTPEEDTTLDRSTFTVEGTCSGCGEPALAEPDGTWVHAEAATHGDNEGHFVPNEPVEEEKPVVEDEAGEDEDLIGTPAPVKATKRSRKNS